MVDHMAIAERCRGKASQHKLSAENTTSTLFANCYRDLAQLLVSTAGVEEDFVRRDMVMKQQANDHLIARVSADRARASTLKSIAQPDNR
jgi:hypothetical protein